MAPENKKIITLVLLLVAFLFYSFNLYTSLPVKDYVASKASVNGKLLWQKYNCNACHQVYGLGGYLGPDLTNVYSARGRDYIKAFIRNGTATMPGFHMTDEEMNDLLGYLKTIDGSGSADPRTFSIKYDGTIEQE